MIMKHQHWEPIFLEGIRRDKNGEIIAYVLKRNQNYRKEHNGSSDLTMQ